LLSFPYLIRAPKIFQNLDFLKKDDYNLHYMTKKLVLSLLLVHLLVILGCSFHPTRIVASTYRAGNGKEPDTIKFHLIGERQLLWFRWYDQGIIKCNVDEKGTLSNCRNMKIEFKD
jgi:hypothetical protein